ncbi:hypothetical protein [Streptomyces naganishii]|uniref:Uncharacterized protein n=1 Tax=Streptomyces naganishii JCM 4654 TaxID=1306179 RepID=A0A918Y4U2_9ACTN|nr:hypothetical protein [Streptomyces naganishii]GHD90643.1 hypothetical protein GCM10010508_36040 [Streptomyces naganishii JCM 4654]
MATIGHPEPLRHSPALPGDRPPAALRGEGLDAARVPAHRLRARLGKRVPRPGGLELTRRMPDAPRIGPRDRVAEPAGGLGATARITLARGPAAYTAADRDPAAVTALSAPTAPGRTGVRGVRADAARTGLSDGTATVVRGEAMPSTHPEPAERRVAAEARRLLADPSGRSAPHEPRPHPGDPAPALAGRTGADLAGAPRASAPGRSPRPGGPDRSPPGASP